MFNFELRQGLCSGLSECFFVFRKQLEIYQKRERYWQIATDLTDWTKQLPNHCFTLLQLTQSPVAQSYMTLWSLFFTASENIIMLIFVWDVRNIIQVIMIKINILFTKSSVWGLNCGGEGGGMEGIIFLDSTIECRVWILNLTNHHWRHRTGDWAEPC